MATGLQFIKQETMTTDEASAFLVTDCFNKGYEVYKIFITKEVRTSTGYGYMRFLDISGSELSGSYYSGASQHVYSTSGSSERREPTRDNFRNFFNYQGTNDADGLGLEINVYNADNALSYTFLTSQASSHYNSSSFLTSAKSIGAYETNAQVYGIKWYPQSGNISNTKITVFGVR